MNYFGDLHAIITDDGLTQYFPDETSRFLVYGNYGAPPTNFVTRRGYKQDGVTEVDFSLDVRTLSIELWHNPACSRVAYWQNRATLHNLLRPNRGGPMTIILTIPNGTKRALMVRANPGLVFAASGEDNSWQVDEPLELVAFDPIWFGPTQISLSAPNAADSQLVFPTTFPIYFGTAGNYYQKQITYAGTWKSYPTLTLAGPYSAATIENTVNGAAIYMNMPIIAGQTRIISLTPGNLSIVDQSGVNRFGELGPNSDLVNFAIYPIPDAPGGVQTIRALIAGRGASTAFTIAYYERYFAI